MSDTTNMSVNDVPAAIQKTVGPFVKRATEVHNAQPLVSYYCYLYAAQLILESQLHLQDEEVAQYIEVLLTQVESDRKSIEESTPKVAELLVEKEKSFKLVLGFSLQILNKAVKEIDGHLATKRTVQSLMAFKDFVTVTKLWPEFYNLQEDEISQQVKYAKYQSGRILKAFKNGEDPNEFVSESEEKELELLLGDSQTGEESQAVEDNEEDDVAEDESSPELTLPQPPRTLPDETSINLPTAPALIKGQKNSLGLPTAPEFKTNSATQPSLSTPPAIPEKPTKPVEKPPKKIPAPPPAQSQPVQSQNIPKDNGTVLTKSEVEEIWKRDEIISKAQKRAKFAISALNYNDIETAIKELEQALAMLRGE